MNPHEELFRRLLDESSTLLSAPESAGIEIPEDDLHREIIVPLLPAMLADVAIRAHWNEQAATGFVARIGRHFENREPAPRWTPGDFEIHVTASYSAGADARALADTLLSEESLRDMTAALMNQLLDALWPSLAPAPGVAAMPQAVPGGIAAEEIVPPAEAAAALEIPGPIISPEPELATVLPAKIAEEVLPPTDQPEPAWQQPSRALIRSLCRKLAAPAVRRGLVTNSATRDTGAAIIARRIFQRATPSREKKRTGSRTACLG
jgi:hypothetical protein